MKTVQTIQKECRKIICIGRNYAAHIAELSSATPKQPFFFLKPASSLLLPNSGPVLRPRGVSLHYEVELGLVMGRRVRDLRPENTEGAMGAIAGYLLAIDMTARNVQDEAKKKGLPWSIAKGFDTFLPVSNFISKDRIPDPQNADLWLSVNNQVKQSDNTNLMLYSITRQLSDISRVMTLEEGDIVLTGTPKGVGEVKSGDVMSAGIKVNGKDVVEASLEVAVEDRDGLYEFKET